MSAPPWSERLARYLALRRALGFAMRAEERLLRDFVAFVDDRGLGDPLAATVAVDWARLTGAQCGPAGQARRLSVARGFLAHVRAAVPETAVPDHGLLARARRRRAHLFTDTEIAALLRAARSLGPRDALRPYTIATLIGLLVSCGLRAGEALRLRLADVDLTAAPPCLHVRQTKFRKSRLVPLHASTATALRAYAVQRARLGYDGVCEHFFVSERPGPLTYHVLARTFVALARRLGFRGPVGTRGPSLHALRHTFAVNRLLAWYQQEMDVRARLPELAVYLGHVRPSDTYWYLSATPELLRLAGERFEQHACTGELP
jgi:integrase/recombinase XerD